MPRALNIAVLGCCHGELHQIYRSIAERSAQAAPIDLLIIGGDFQAVRNHADLSCMSVPDKYKRLGNFHQYYSGKAKAPVLTLFVGGNHESSAYMQELYHGGWVAPNIYYLGSAGIVRYKGLRIAGISGIWQKEHYIRGYNECPPYTSSSLRSVYHVRQFEVQRLLAAHQAQPGIDIFLSHDWPRGIEQHGDTAALLKKKPFFKAEVARNDLGSPANETLLAGIKPRYWFSAHLHVRFQAEVVHGESKKRSREATPPVSSTGRELVANPDEITVDFDDDDEEDVSEAKDPNEIQLELSDDEVAAESKPSRAIQSLEEYKKQVLQRYKLNETPSSKPDSTQFLALDKCLPRRQYLEYISIETTEESSDDLCYDPTWLATTRAMAPYFSTGAYQCELPDPVQLQAEIAEARRWLDAKHLDLTIPHNFERTAPAEDLSSAKRTKVHVYNNPQTSKFVEMLEIPNPFVKVGSGWEPRPARKVAQ
ncbi:lariat debranching enzyme, C-terminal domain-domain-containing protein [Protomyces lactucae-debilis]|uniref:Lariat debranching enzyme, C-terminal domain-domain-containing protein n=1 Tax=Protomyces lactucae-debilis TaxID=2754530 RepID=A0A1Y2FNS7_PROLT|nr:lariat debranching enzyme, C-terminal domain-containing protein [Protomyces lactucae-debilis]ORY85613.1 lariat debranching enzyme, C-terminal domain-domain-containing protein [Protomyces lactucae-debilis]